MEATNETKARTRMSRTEQVRLVQECWVCARLSQTKEMKYEHPDRVTREVAAGRPFFIIDAVMEACGYAPRKKDWRKWNVVKRWMYGRRTGLRTGKGRNDA